MDARDSLLLDEGSRHSCGRAKVLLGIECICRMYVWADIAPVGFPACIPKSPSGDSGSARDGGGVGLEEVELVGWIFVDGTTNYDQKH